MEKIYKTQYSQRENKDLIGRYISDIGIINVLTPAEEREKLEQILKIGYQIRSNATKNKDFTSKLLQMYESGDFVYQKEAKEFFMVNYDSLKDYVDLKENDEELEQKLANSPVSMKKFIRVLREQGIEGEDKKILEEYIRLRNDFVNFNLRLVIYFAKKSPYAKDNLIDIIDAGNSGLVGAVEEFKYKKGNKFSTFAGHKIRGEIWKWTRDHLKYCKMISLDQILETKAEQVYSPLNSSLVKDPSEKCESSDLKERILDRLKELPEREAQTVIKYFGLINGINMTYEEVGNDMGVTKQAIHVTLKKALRKLKRFEELENLFLNQ